MNFLTRLLFLEILIAGSCNNSAEKLKDKNTVVQVKPKETETLQIPGDDVMKRGQIVYKQVCLACHQANGSGVPMMYPPIKESDVIAGDHEKLIKQVLEGMSGPVEIKGEQYNGIMPPQKNILNDQQISDLLTFLRRSFGNSADAISAEEVARIRK